MCVNSTIRPGDLVVVLGPGPIGLLCARMAALAGADPLIVVGLSERRAAAARRRASWARRTPWTCRQESLEDVVRGLDPLGADLVCDASGASRPLDAALAPGQARRPGDEGGLVAGQRARRHEPAGRQERRGCRDRSATTIRCGSASSICSTARPDEARDHRRAADRPRRLAATPSTRCTTARSSSRCCCPSWSRAGPSIALTDRVALVTGSTSGIGRGIAEHFAALGARRRRPRPRASRRVETVVAALRGAGREAAYRRRRRRRRGGLPRRWCAATVERFGGLDVLVNNAGQTSRGDLETSTVAFWDASWPSTCARRSS